MQTIKKVQRQINPSLKVDGVLLTLADMRTNLILELLELVDNSVLKGKDELQIALCPAVELSYLSEEEGAELYEMIKLEDCVLSHA